MNVGSIAPQTATSVSSDDSAPFFADGVLEKARANKKKLAAFNQAHVEEPALLGKAIRKHYANHPLVRELKDSLRELSQERGQEYALVFGAPTFMILTQYGFGTCVKINEYGYGRKDKGRLEARVLDLKIPVGERGTAAGVRLKIDEMLIKFAENTEHHARSDVGCIEAKLKPVPPKAQEQAALKAPERPVAQAPKKRGLLRRIFHRH